MTEENIEDIRESLMQQLEAKGANVAHFRDKINEYLFYVGYIHRMKESLETVGMTYTAHSAHGKEYEKDNPALKALPTYTDKALKILREMKLTTDEPVNSDDEEL